MKVNFESLDADLIRAIGCGQDNEHSTEGGEPKTLKMN